MMGGGETTTGDKDGVRTAAIHVPIGWQRRVEGGHVVYVSPSGVMLPSLDEVKAYLLTDGTCKCGLECPLVIAKVFSFSVGAKVEHCPPLGKAEQDMTKLCNHRRKVVAMAALCRSMQASPLPFHGLQHPENSGVPDHHREPKRARPEDHPHHHHKPRLQPLPCPAPRHPSQLTHPYNGASPVGPHLDALRRLQPPPPPLLPPSSSPSPSSPSPLLYGAPQWSPRPAPGPQNLSQGQRSTPRTPEGPGSPRVGPLASPPPPTSSPSPRSMGARPPPSPSPSPSSPSVHGASCASPRGQRSRHPSSSASSLSGEHGGGVVAGADGSPFPPPRRKSSSSSPLSPLPGGSPSPGLHFRYKVEDLLEHCRTHGPLPANQSSGFSALKPPKSPQGAMGSSLGPFLHPASFPASSLLSAAAKAQLAASQASPGGDAPGSASPLEPPHPHQQKVTNSTLLGSHHSPPSLLLLPPHYTLVASPSSSSPSPGPPSHHRKRQRRASKDPQPLANGARRTPPGDAIINLSSSSSSFPPSTSACVVDAPHHLHHRHPYLLAPPGHTPRLSPRPTPVLAGPPRQTEALDFTTGLGGGFPGPDPPTQPLSALLHLLSVQNAQAASSSAALQVGAGPSRGGGAAGSRHSPRPLSFSSSSSSSSPASHSGLRSVQTPSPRRHGNPAPLALSPAPSPSLCPSPSLTGPVPSPSRPPVQRLSPLVLSPPTPGPAGCFSFPVSTAPPTPDRQPASSATLDLSRSRGSAVPTATPASPKPLDLSNHVLALLAASSSSSTAAANHTTGPEEVVGSGSRPPECHSSSGDPGHPVPQPHPPATASPSPLRDGCSPPGPGSSPGDTATPLSLAEAFPFMNQEQLLQLLSATGGLPSLLDPALLASLPLGGALWLGGQQQQAGHLPPSPSQSPPEQQQQQQQPHLLVQTQDHHHHNQQKHHHHHHHQQLFPLLPSLVGAHGDLPLGLLGLLNPLLPPPGPPGPDGDMGALAAEKAGLQALLMASLLLGCGQHHQGGGGGGGPMLPPLGLEEPLQPDGLDPSGTAGVSLQGGPGLLEMLQGLLLTPGSAHEGPLQALLLPGPLAPPTQPHAFLPLSPALLSALGGADMHQPPSQVTSDPGVDTLIPLPLQSKDNPILQQLLPTLLNPAVLGDLSCLASLQNLLGLGAGHLLLPAGQASALGMPLLHGPDGAINLLNNIQLNIAPPPEGDKPMPPQETQSPPRQQDPAANHVASPEAVPSSPAPDRSPAPPPPQQHRGGGGIIDPYTSFMDTIYTSFLQVSAKEQRGGGGGGDPVSPFCALPPVSFPGEGGPALSPRRACSLRHPELSRLSLEAAARSPAQGTPRPSDDAPAGPRQRGKEGGGGRGGGGGGGGHAHAHSEQPPLPPAYLEEAKTDCAPWQPLRPYGDGPGGGGGVGLRAGEMVGSLLHTEQEGDQVGAAVGGRRGRKRKQTLQKVLEDFRDMDTTALEETKPTTALLKPERAGRGRRRRGARSQRQ